MPDLTRFDISGSPLGGAQLIEASAGTGKTYTIAGLYLRLVIEQRLPVEEILVVTFTEAATEELRGRIRGRLREALAVLEGGKAPEGDELLASLRARHARDEAAIINLRDSLRDFDRSAIFTIHGFCRRALREHAFESGASFDARLAPDIEGLRGEIADDFWRTHFYSVSPHILHYAGQKIRDFGPRYFLGLLRGRPLDPQTRLEPRVEAPDAARMERVFGSLDDCYGRLREAWAAGREGLRELLLSSSGRELSGTKYRRDSIPKWFEEMGSFLNGGNAFAEPDCFERFIPSKLEASVKKGMSAPRHALFDLCEDLKSRRMEASALAEGFLMHLRVEFLGYAARELRVRARRENTRSFDDLLESMHRALAGGERSALAVSMRFRFKAALIDEFQDTDPVQYAIFRTIFGVDSILFLIGDPKQAIYGFRGADIFAYMRASEFVARRHTLEVNHRAEPDLIGAVNTVFSRAENPFVFRDISFQPAVPSPRRRGEGLHADGGSGAALRLWFLESQEGDKSIGKQDAARRIARAVATEIFLLLEAGTEGRLRIDGRALLPGDIAVLTRTNDQARAVQHELFSRGVPGVLYGAESVFASREASELARLLEAIAAPGLDSGIRAALATDIFGYDGGALLELMDRAWDARRADFEGYRELWARHGFIRMFRAMLEREGVAVRLLSFPDGERRMTNLLHIAEILHRTERALRPGMEGLIKWLHERRQDPGESDEEQLRLETDENAVKLHTVHRSKGLEYPVVFCPFLWDSSRINSRRYGSGGGPVVYSFHDEADNNLPVLDLGSGREEYRRAAERELLAENLRLMYVALTRAKYRCYLAWGKINESDTSAPAYLFHSEGIERSADVLDSLSAAVKPKTARALLMELESLAAASGGSISIGALPDGPAGVYTPEARRAAGLECRAFRGRIPRDWRISSYSSMTARRAADEARDFGEEGGPDVEAQAGRADIFAFPKGARAGRLIHGIFERCDFSDSAGHEELVAGIVRESGFEERWRGPLCAMLRNVLAAPLEDGTSRFSLSTISSSERLHELEFYFPLGAATPHDVAGVFRARGKGAVSDFAAEIEGLGAGRLRGFLRGFIDMVFRHGERFYIVDWKSNHLGGAAEDYTRERMESEMRRHYYILQYHLYMVALDRYLAARLKDYAYESHFGGIFYIFVRGVDARGNADSGIYYDRPDERLARALCECLTGDGGR